MKRTCFFTCLLLIYLLISPVSYAQIAKSDSLISLLETTTETEARQELLKSIANIYEYSGEWDNYHRCALQMLELAHEENDSSWIAEAYNKLGISSCYTGKNEKAIEYFTLALEINEAMKEYASVANSYENLGIVYNEMGDFDNAIECQLKSVEIRKPINYPRLFNNYINLSVLYGAIKNTDKQGYYIDLAKQEISSQQGISAESKAIFYSGLGDLYDEQGLNDSSVVCYKKVISYSQEAEWNRGITSGLGSLANVFRKKGELDSAIVYHQKSLELSERIGESMSITEELFALAEIYSQKGDHLKALSYSEKALENARSCNLMEIESQILEFIAGYYAGKKDYKKAYEYYISYRTVEDSIRSAAVINKMAELETQHQTKEKEQQIELLSAENQIKSQRVILFIAISVSLFLILAGGVMIFFRKKKENQQKQETLSQQLLRLQMNPHFLFNALGSIQNYILNNNVKEAAGYLNNFALLTRAILEHSAVESVLLEDEIGALQNYIKLEQMRMQNSFSYSIEFEGEVESELIQIPPMLIQPFVENAIKHGLSNVDGKLGVSFKDCGDTLRVVISDNGKGIVESSTQDKSHKPMAMVIFAKRMNLLKKRYSKKSGIHIDSSINEGTKVSLHIPVIG
ncbi:MAG: tetratricopeptide repeat protein [Clostridia bacterium]|nr:tetratricopeptide repeat protein [Clostridia bacterium]